MLTRRPLVRRLSVLAKGVAVVALVLGSGIVAQTALADGGVYCPPRGGPCVVVVGTPGSPGSGGNTGGGGGHDPICHEEFGCTIANDICYYKEASPQPPKSDEVWAGHTDGIIYMKTCSKLNGPLGVPMMVATWVWFAQPPPGAGLPSPAVLAANAINQLGFTGPAIGIAPNPGGSGLVGLPVWMWTDVGPQTWGPVSATASVPGLSVTATARASKIVWYMGDGQSVTCANPGTPYEARYGNRASDTCGYRYTKTSRNQDGGRFTITATTTWDIEWAGGGESGQLSVIRESTTTVQINELQVVTS